ncbi:MAG: molybdopterin-dependent oxidoreductase [Polyangiales bacterium]
MSATTLVKTACNRDCPDACGIVAHVTDGRVTRLQGDPEHPVTRGFLCYRTDQFLHRQYSPERLTAPLVRRGGELVPSTWDEALDLCARELLRVRAESGPAAVFHYRSGGSLGLMKHVTDHFFSRFGPVTSKRGDICGGAGDAAQLADFGDEDANDLHDLLHAKAVVLWGKNPHTSSPHLLPLLQELRRKGAPIALVDPVAHRGVKLADRFVQPRPGGDVALALGVARCLFQRNLTHPDAARWCEGLDGFEALAMSRSLDAWAREADVPVADVEALAELYGTNSPAAILVGWGMQRRTNGSAIVRCLDALGLVTGNVGVSGGGVSYYFRRRGAFDTSFVHVAPPPRELCEPLFGEEILTARDPEVRSVWITAGNPVAMLPDSHATVKALASREFVVVVDSTLTDTARLATVVLPCATMLEDDDVVGAYGNHHLNVVRPVVRTEGAWTDYEIVQALAARTGLAEHFTGDARSWKRRMLRAMPLDELERGPARNPLAPKVAFEGRVFPTASGKARLVTELPVEAARPGGEFPLLLHALSTPESQSSQWSPAEPDALAEARVHPAVAGGIASGQRARLRSALGAMEVTVVHDATMRRDVVLVPKGGSLARGRCANAITRARLTDAGEGAALYEEPVRLEAIGAG